MAGSTYSTNLKIELMSTGENSGTWGDITNTNLGTALEQAIVGYGNPDYVADANLTITISNSNSAQAARALVLNVTSVFGSLTATRELVVPTIQKQYIVQNNTTGGQSITVKTSAGTGITVPNGRKAHLYVDGTNVIQMFDFVDINGGTIDGATVGASSASSGAFTTLTASGATTLNGAVTLGDAAGDNITFNGTVTSHLLFTDNTYDIGASGATRPRNLYLAGAATIGGNLSVGGTLTLTGGLTLNGNVTVGDSSSDTLTINSTITSNLLFTDNTYDIGASGATRPRNLFLAGNATIGGNQTLTGSLTVDSTTDSSSTTTGSIQTDGGVGIAKALYVGLDANIYGITVGRGAGAVSTNTAVGASALNNNTTGSYNQAVGVEALRYNTDGIANTALGAQAAITNTSGGRLVALGNSALYANTTGSYNTAVGVESLRFNTTASNNTAVGYQAGYSITTSTQNTAFGVQALRSHTTGSSNTAIGYASQYSTTTASNNISIGDGSMYANTTGANNVGIGVESLRYNTTASNNTAVGYQAAYSTTTAGDNVAVGHTALRQNTTGNSNVAIGYAPLYNNTTGNNNVAIGLQALVANTTASNNTAVGYQAGYSNTTGEIDAFGKWALYSNTTGTRNAAFAINALLSNTTGASNSAFGRASLSLNTTGNYNTGIGDQALYSNTTANNNTAVGYQAGYSSTGAGQTLIGQQSGYNVSSGTYNTFVGQQAGYYVTTGGKNTIIGTYNGNQGGLDIRTANNYIVLSDGDGNPRNYIDGGGYPTWKTSDAAGNTWGFVGEGATNGYALWHNWNTGSSYFDLRLGGTTSTYTVARFKLDGIVVLKGGDTTATGTGITFPATQSASSNANTLDDYEEGTWTPTFKGSTTAGTYNYSTRVGRYTKIGNMVTVWCTLVDIVASSAGSGEMYIGGLPFTVLNDQGFDRAPNGAARVRQMATALPETPNVGAIKNTTDAFLLMKDGVSDSGVAIATYFADNMDIGFTLTYQA